VFLESLDNGSLIRGLRALIDRDSTVILLASVQPGGCILIFESSRIPVTYALAVMLVAE